MEQLDSVNTSFIIIDMTNKSATELYAEIEHKVDTIINKLLTSIKGELNEIDYKLISRKMEKKKVQIMNQFVFQLVNRSKINSVN